jgi:protein Tex
VSELADRFVKDPHEVVKAGDIVSVRVVEVDVKRKRIALSMKKQASGPRETRDDKRGPSPSPKQMQAKPAAPSAPGGLGAALMEAMKRK